MAGSQKPMHEVQARLNTTGPRPGPPLPGTLTQDLPAARSAKARHQHPRRRRRPGGLRAAPEQSAPELPPSRPRPRRHQLLNRPRAAHWLLRPTLRSRLAQRALPRRRRAPPPRPHRSVTGRSSSGRGALWGGGAAWPVNRAGGPGWGVRGWLVRGVRRWLVRGPGGTPEQPLWAPKAALHSGPAGPGRALRPRAQVRAVRALPAAPACPGAQPLAESLSPSWRPGEARPCVAVRSCCGSSPSCCVSAGDTHVKNA
ncbi:translation initiation factor IF-2-like [Apus apus]|uniref:translation initiation factor IF-2-like n=1 Tax=Apus apus TaxID=8895 RepID=UPI0021F816F0|nr:translation initiation factor IF-2-like [Apus apus]